MAWRGSRYSKSGWVICNGDSYSKTTYSDGYTSIGNSFGSSSTTFKVPDLETNEKFVMGAHDHSEINYTGGSETHTLTINEMPEHTHSAHFIGKRSGNDGSAQIVDKTTNSKGGGDPHNNLPPYIKLHYIIKLELH